MSAAVFLLSDQMARTKNVGGGLGDDDRRPPPRLPAGTKGKATKQVTSKKHKYPNAETVRAAAVAETHPDEPKTEQSWQRSPEPV